MDTTKVQKKKFTFKECTWCRIRATKQLFNPCPKCGASLYCCEECQQADTIPDLDEKHDAAFESRRYFKHPQPTHQFWCHKLKKYMEHADDLLKFPFTFTKETAADEFDFEKYSSFLQVQGVQGSGLWRVETPTWEFFNNRNKELDDETSKSYVLPVEDDILGSPPDVPPSHSLTSWSEYYQYRELRLDSPVAILLQWPLTLYYIITMCNSDKKKILDQQDIYIDMVGVAKELDLTHVFKELEHILPGKNIHIHMYGKEFPRSFTKNEVTMDNVKVMYYHQYYRKSHHTDGKEGLPDFVIGFNAGLAAYASWAKTLKYIKMNEIPAYFTDYCQQSIDISREMLQKRLGIETTPAMLNPFKGPVRTFSNDCNIPVFSNAFWFNLVYNTGPSKDSE